jgi:GntR family transcriptional regulator
MAGRERPAWREAAEAVSAYRRVAGDIAARIASGDLRPGDRLPAERELAEHYETGWSPVRHALRALREQGLIATIPGHCSFVLAPGDGRLLDAWSESARPWATSRLFALRRRQGAALVKMRLAVAELEQAEREAERMTA